MFLVPTGPLALEIEEINSPATAVIPELPIYWQIVAKTIEPINRLGTTFPGGREIHTAIWLPGCARPPN